jgi:hypothetical protein
MHDLLYLLLGWLLGLLSPGIAERIRRKQKARDLVTSVVGELAELQYTVALVGARLRMKLGTNSDVFLDWLLPIVKSYKGAGKIQGFDDTVAKLRQVPEEQRRQADIARRDDARGLALKRYEAPFLLTQGSELFICPLDFQRRVFRIKSQLDVFNQQVDYLRSQFEKTFEVEGHNREAVEGNLQEGYADLATLSESLAKAIGDVIFNYGGKVAS